MARTKRPRKASPKTPSRVKKREAQEGEGRRAHHHPELIGSPSRRSASSSPPSSGSASAAARSATSSRSGIGAAAYLAPLVLVPLGALMVAKSALVDVRPFQLGLVVGLTGLMLTLGSGHGGVARRRPRVARRRSASARPARRSSACC